MSYVLKHFVYKMLFIMAVEGYLKVNYNKIDYYYVEKIPQTQLKKLFITLIKTFNFILKGVKNTALFLRCGVLLRSFNN